MLEKNFLKNRFISEIFKKSHQLMTLSGSGRPDSLPVGRKGTGDPLDPIQVRTSF